MGSRGTHPSSSRGCLVLLLLGLTRTASQQAPAPIRRHDIGTLANPPPLDGWYCGIDRHHCPPGDAACTINIICPMNNRDSVPLGYWCDWDDTRGYCYCGGNDNLMGRYERCAAGLVYVPTLMLCIDEATAHSLYCGGPSCAHQCINPEPSHSGTVDPLSCSGQYAMPLQLYDKDDNGIYRLESLDLDTGLYTPLWSLPTGD